MVSSSKAIHDDHLSGAGPFAHSLADTPHDQWEPLAAHARNVSDTASGFAAAFGAGKAGSIAGILHDIGKVSHAFQSYIGGTGPSPEHSSAGAVVADALYTSGAERLIGRLVAFAIAGHHAGLSARLSAFQAA